MRHPVYRGVWSRNNDKWVCEMKQPKKKFMIWLGTYLTAEMATRAHDVAALAFRGKHACLNYASDMNSDDKGTNGDMKLWSFSI